MTDEELKELKKIVDDAVISSYADFTLEEGYNLVCLIEAEQQKRSARTEDVELAIKYQKDYINEEQQDWNGLSEEWQVETGAKFFHDEFIKVHSLSITALEAYHPKESCETCKNENMKLSIREKVEYDFDDRDGLSYGYEWTLIKANYCPNCGRKLETNNG